MQAVILAAGEGTRMHPLTFETPKPLLRAGGKNLVEHNLANLPNAVDELVFVVGYMEDKIRNYFGTEYEGRKITYVHQEEPLGTGHALSLCKDTVAGRFIVMMADDLYSRHDVAKCITHERAWLVKRTQGAFTGGRIISDENGTVLDVLEGEHDVEEGLVGVNFFVLTPEIFDYEPVRLPGRSEYGLPQTVANMARDFPIQLVEATDWVQLTSIDDLRRLRERLGDTPGSE